MSQPLTLDLPGIGARFSLELPPDLQALREGILDRHQRPKPPLIETALSDAREWAAHTDAEDWLLWRARRVAGRLRSIPFETLPGESLVGVPWLREPSDGEQDARLQAGRTLAAMPPFPGGDTGHFHPNFERLLSTGIGGLLKDIDSRRRALPAGDPRQPFYAACRLSASALSAYVQRAADACRAMSLRVPAQAGHWTHMASVCGAVALSPPATFHQALQLMFLILTAAWYGEDHSQSNLGRMDQTLRPFYEADLAAGRLTPRQAFEIICCAYVQMNRIHWPGGAVAVIVGGPNAAGRDVTNDLTYLCLAARLATRLVYPTVAIAWHRNAPCELMDFAVDMLSHGCGDPAFFNDEVISRGLRARGVADEDCHDFMNSTCVEIKVTGKSNIWVATPYFNLPQALLDAMGDVAQGRFPDPPDFETFNGHVRVLLASRIASAAQELDRTWRRRERHGCFPLASCLIDDCLARGRDHDRGGARYNWVENSCVGLANLVDGLVAVRRLVFETRELTLTALLHILQQDFKDHEPLRQRMLNCFPHYGNDQTEADRVASEWTDFLMRTTESHTVGGAPYCPGFFCWIQHERLGAETGATPDGRRAGFPFSDGAGAAQGRETCGPTAAVLSTTKWPHDRALGGLVQNLKLTRDTFRDATGRRAVRHLIETYLRRGGFEVQINVVDRETLFAARRHPEQYRELVVRVAGYSDYFVHLTPQMQDEVIARSEHRL